MLGVNWRVLPFVDLVFVTRNVTFISCNAGI